MSWPTAVVLVTALLCGALVVTAVLHHLEQKRPTDERKLSGDGEER